MTKILAVLLGVAALVAGLAIHRLSTHVCPAPTASPAPSPPTSPVATSAPAGDDLQRRLVELAGELERERKKSRDLEALVAASGARSHDGMTPPPQLGRVTADFVDRPAFEILQEIAKGSGLSLVVTENVLAERLKGTRTSLSFRDQPFDDVMKQLSASMGVSMARRLTSLWVWDPSTNR